jgi:hypothetical protein
VPPIERSEEIGRARLNVLLAMRANSPKKQPGAEEQLALPGIVWPCRFLPFGTSRTGSTGPSQPPAGAVSLGLVEHLVERSLLRPLSPRLKRKRQRRNLILGNCTEKKAAN